MLPLNMVRQLFFTTLFQNGMLTLMFLIMMEEALCIGNQEFAIQPFFYIFKQIFSFFYLLHSTLQSSMALYWSCSLIH